MASTMSTGGFFQSLHQINENRKKRKAKNPPSLTAKTPLSSQVKMGKNGMEPRESKAGKIGNVKPYTEEM